MKILIIMLEAKTMFETKTLFEMQANSLRTHFIRFPRRAVVWTDFIQFLLMLNAVIVIIMLGTNGVGGFANVWSAAERGGRLILFK